MMTIEFDRSLFSADVVSRAAHRWTAAYFVDVHATADALRVTLTPKPGATESDVGTNAFRTDVLDEHLRELVRTQTRELEKDFGHHAYVVGRVSDGAASRRNAREHAAALSTRARFDIGRTRLNACLIDQSHGRGAICRRPSSGARGANDQIRNLARMR